MQCAGGRPFAVLNFTGAGLGAKNDRRRNLEVGAVTRQPNVVKALSDHFDAFWMGEHYRDWAFRADCPDPIV